MRESIEHPVKAEDATIKTATVEVKVIRINNRQMTLAVFRQIPIAGIIDRHTGGLLGDPWGRVNYCPTSYCGEAGPHIHVVWQNGNELKRDTIVSPDVLFRPNAGMARAVSHIPVEEWGLTEYMDYQRSWERLMQSDQLFIAV